MKNSLELFCSLMYSTSIEDCKWNLFICQIMGLDYPHFVKLYILHYSSAHTPECFNG